jgi:hypothetical protein
MFLYEQYTAAAYCGRQTGTGLFDPPAPLLINCKGALVVTNCPDVEAGNSNDTFKVDK